MAADTLTERDTLRRLLAVVAAACVALFGWSATRELAQISEATRSTNTHLERLDTALRGLLVDNASLTRRLDYVEEMTRANGERIERGCRP